VGQQVARREDAVIKPVSEPQRPNTESPNTEAPKTEAPKTEAPSAGTRELHDAVSLRVLLFAAARDRVGADVVTIDVEAPTTAAAVLSALGDRFPDLAPLLPSCRLAVDQSFVAPGHAVYPHHELALIPPVSGG
jgi:molybdopterin converting factor small subunit